MKIKKTPSRTRKPVVLPDDACPNCGTQMKKTKGKKSFPINGENIFVPDIAYLKCSKCGEILINIQEIRRLREGALEIYRKKYGLLPGEEIRRLRERFGITQGQLAKLLKLGVNTISRWESGRNVQTAAMDILLRLVRDLPGSMEYLQKLAA